MSPIDKDPNELAVLMSSVSLTPRAPVRSIVPVRGVIVLTFSVFPSTGDSREDARPMVPRKRAREEPEAPNGEVTVNGTGKLYLI